MVHPDEAVVVVLRFQDVDVLGRKPEVRLRLIDRRQVVSEIGRQERRLGAPLGLIIGKEKRRVLADRPSQSDPELILVQGIR